MIKGLTTRAEKIKLLNDLKTGKANINEVFPVLPEHWVFEKSRGVYSRGDQELNEGEFKALQTRKGKNYQFIITEIISTVVKHRELLKTYGNYDKESYEKHELTIDNPPFDSKQVDKIISALSDS